MAHQDNLVPRCSNDSEAQDHTSMTIEFLRARLLAERAVSKSARAKLDGLSDKVAELEEQLKIVSLQRKKAEQATADVLAILEEYGFHDDDSSSDQESYSQTTTKSMSAKSLSWKGRWREADSSQKTKESRNRRQRGFVSAYFSSPRHRQGRSCRQIKRSESRTVSEDHKRDGDTVVDLQEKGGSTQVLPITSEEADVTVVKGDESLQKLSCSYVLEKENSMDIKLEKALRKRAQVVGSYGDMEETQKQWEKKFTENKSSALDLCDVGNHSDVTDESNGEKAQGSTLVPSHGDTRSIANEVHLREPFETSSHGSPDNSVTSPDKFCKSCGSKSVEEEASPSGDNGKQISESPKSESSHAQNFKGISEHASSTTRAPHVPRPNSRGGSFCSNATNIQKVDYHLVPVTKEKSDGYDTVLNALKQAKLSLQEKVNSLHIRKHEYLSESSYPSTPGSYMNTYALPIEPAFDTKPSLPASNVGLFRVPTDFSPDASTRNSFQASGSQKALVNHIQPERDIPLLPGVTKALTSTKNLLDSGFQSQLLDTERPLTTPYICGPKLWTGFKADGEPVVDTQDSRVYKGTQMVSGSVRTSGFEGNQLASTSFKLDRQVSTYTPMSPSRSLYPDSVLRSREMYSTPYYTPAVGLPPTDGSGEGLYRRV